MRAHLTFIFIITTLSSFVSADNDIDFTDDDFKLVNKSAMDFNLCVNENAASILEKYDDVREAAAHTVDHCEKHFEELKSALGDKAESNYYKGIERHMKNRSIKKLLPMMMYQKSRQQNPESRAP